VDLEALTRSPVGRLVPISGTDPRSGIAWQYYAFVPSPLPEAPALSLRALHIATNAAMEVARLDQAVSQLPNPEILTRPIVRREAVSTSALEGTYVAFNDVLEADFLEERQLSSEQREVRNYIFATEQAMHLLEQYPISRRLVGRLQKTIVRGTPGDTFDAGEIRQHQVCIGPRNRPIQEARFVPPPPGDDLVEGVSDWEKWVNADNSVPIIAKVALAHYQFETLHPFADGNGRIGRLTAILQLIQEGVLRSPILNLSPMLEANRDEYQDGLLNVTKTGLFSGWVEFFSDAVARQANEGVRRINDLLSLRDRMIAGLRAAGVRGSALQIAENLIGYPVLDVPTARNMTGKTFMAANQAVARLVEQGILREITGRRQDRLFMCQEVISIIDS
jgi:cell filamentation protein, protein adenylyltransferase